MNQENNKSLDPGLDQIRKALLFADEYASLALRLEDTLASMVIYFSEKVDELEKELKEKGAS